MNGSTLAESMEHVAKFFEGIAALILIARLVVAAGLALRLLYRSTDAKAAYRVLRGAFGGAILLGLAVLVAADLIRTVAVEPTLENVVILVLTVLIRTVLSFSLEIEIEGCRALAAGGHRNWGQSPGSSSHMQWGIAVSDGLALALPDRPVFQ